MATFTWVPFYTPEISTSHRVLKSTMEGGKEQRKYKGRNPTVWKLTFQCLYSDAVAIQTFYESRKGTYESFTWTDPYSGATKTVRFLNESLDIKSEWKINGLFEIEFVEVL